MTVILRLLAKSSDRLVAAEREISMGICVFAALMRISEVMRPVVTRILSVVSISFKKHCPRPRCSLIDSISFINRFLTISVQV